MATTTIDDRAAEIAARWKPLTDKQIAVLASVFRTADPAKARAA